MPFDFKISQNTRSDNSPQKSDFQFNEHGGRSIEAHSENAGKILYSWRAPQFEVYEKSGRWYIIAAFFVLALLVYAIYTNSPLMAVTFILVGIVGYIYSQKDPNVVTFSVTDKGILADREFYSYENIHSFWIFYYPGHTKIVSLHTKASTFPFVHLPIGEENPARLHEILIENIPEIKQEHSLVDTIGRVLHI